MRAKVHVGDVGTAFEATVKDQDDAIVDISLATVRKLRFKKPSGTVLEKTALLVNDGSDGKMKYVTVAGDIDEAGEWQIEGYVEIGNGKWSSDVHRETVRAVL